MQNSECCSSLSQNYIDLQTNRRKTCSGVFLLIKWADVAEYTQGSDLLSKNTPFFYSPFSVHSRSLKTQRIICRSLRNVKWLHWIFCYYAEMWEQRDADKRIPLHLLFLLWVSKTNNKLVGVGHLLGPLDKRRARPFGREKRWVGGGRQSACYFRNGDREQLFSAGCADRRARMGINSAGENSD